MPSLPPNVNPGDLITADLINSVLDVLRTLDTTVSDLTSSLLTFQLGSLVKDTHTLLALGTGFETGGGMWLDGEPLLINEPSRGINVVILTADLIVKHRQSYDTHGSATQAEQLASDLTNLTNRYDIVMAVTHDAYSLNLTQNARAALASVGAAALAETGEVRDSGAFIGVVPENQTGVSFNYITAFIPADGSGTGAARVAGLPFAWGVYSRPLQRFLLGGATSHQPGTRAVAPTTPTTPTLTIPTRPTLTFPTGPTLTFPTGPTLTIPTGPILTVPIDPTLTIPTGPILTVPIDPTLTVPTRSTVTIPTGPTLTIPTRSTLTIPTAPTLRGPVPINPIVGPGSPGVIDDTDLAALAAEPVTTVRGIGPRRAEALARFNINTVGDLADAPLAQVMEATGLSEDPAADFIAEARNLLQRPPA